MQWQFKSATAQWNRVMTAPQPNLSHTKTFLLRKHRVRRRRIHKRQVTYMPKRASYGVPQIYVPFQLFNVPGHCGDRKLIIVDGTMSSVVRHRPLRLPSQGNDIILRRGQCWEHHFTDTGKFHAQANSNRSLRLLPLFFCFAVVQRILSKAQKGLLISAYCFEQLILFWFTCTGQLQVNLPSKYMWCQVVICWVQ